MAEDPPQLQNDLELIRAMKMMTFVFDPKLAGKEAQRDLIAYFEEAYGDTAQETVVYAPELVIVVRRILQGYRPAKLVYLTDFEGEQK